MKRSTRFILILFLTGAGLSFVFHRVNSLRPTASLVSETGERRIPERVICAAPNVVETVFSLGMGDRVIGISDFTTYPPEAAQIEKIGGYINPNLERIVALQPDLVIVQTAMEKVSTLCRQKKIPRVQVDMEDLNSIYSGIQKIGDALDCRLKADRLIEEMQASFAGLRVLASQLNTSPKVFLCIGRQTGSLNNVTTVSDRTYLGEILQIAGGKNIYGELKMRYPQISKESLMIRSPDVIIEFRIDNSLQAKIDPDVLRDWELLPHLPAVASGNIYLVTEDFMLVPGPRSTLAAKRIFELIHAESNSRLSECG